jgi:hypothetical protein
MKSWHFLGPLMAIGGAALLLQQRSHEASLARLQHELTAIESRSQPDSAESPTEARIEVVQMAPTAAPPAPPSTTSEAARGPATAPPPPARQLTSQEMRDQYEIDFLGEPEDGAWAPAARGLATNRLKTTVPAGSAVRSIDCRTSFCRIESMHPDMDHFREFVQSSLLNPESSIWNAATYSSVVEDTSRGLVAVSYVSREGQYLPKLE